jgi:hypothetical protein
MLGAMSKKFTVRREVLLPAGAEQVWAAVTEGSAGWLWPIEFEAHVGGSGPWGSTITAWDPPTHFANHAAKDDWFNSLDYTMTPHDGGTQLQYVHSGAFVDNWDTQYAGASKHTDFYLHTLGQYLQYFPGRAATYVSAEAPDASNSADGFMTLRRALGIGAGSAAGDVLSLDLAGAGRLDVTIDYLVPEFVGLRGGDALYCFFGRNAFGAPVALGHHLFGNAAQPDVDQPAAEAAWQTWLNNCY